MKLIALALALIASQVSALRTEAHEEMVPAIVDTFQCDGNSYKCKVQLKFGHNNYWANWSVAINTNPPS